MSRDDCPYCDYEIVGAFDECRGIGFGVCAGRLRDARRCAPSPTFVLTWDEGEDPGDDLDEGPFTFDEFARRTSWMGDLRASFAALDVGDETHLKISLGGEVVTSFVLKRIS